MADFALLESHKLSPTLPFSILQANFQDSVILCTMFFKEVS